MKREELIEAIRAGRAEVQAAWADIDEALLTRRPGPQSDWSVKDLIAHLSYWPQSIVRDVRAALKGETPPSIANPTPVDEVNARVFSENRDRPLAAVQTDFHAAAEQVIELARSLSEDDLNNPSRFPWLNGEPLAERLAGETYEHFAEHLAELRAWKETQAG